MNQSELLAKVTTIEAKVVKVKEEVIALKEAFNNAGVTSPEVDAAFDRLEGHLQMVDDINPDVPVVDPIDPPPVDPVVPI